MSSNDVKLMPNERLALLKLPVSLRKRLAVFFNWPELAVDRRGKHWSEKKALTGSEDFTVQFNNSKSAVKCTLAVAAAHAGVSPAWLEDSFKGYSRNATFYVDGNEVTVTRIRVRRT